MSSWREEEVNIRTGREVRNGFLAVRDRFELVRRANLLQGILKEKNIVLFVLRIKDCAWAHTDDYCLGESEE